MAQQLTKPRPRREVRGPRRLPSIGHRDALWAFVAFGFLVTWTVGVGLTERQGFPSPLWHFAFAVGWSGVAVAFPFVVLLPVVVPFSNELSRRWIFYSRTRASIRRRLIMQAWRNAWVTFLVFAAYVLVVFLVFYYLLPSAGMEYEPGAIQGATDADLARLTGLLSVHPLTYAAAYAAWQGANAAVWATVGFVAILVIRQRVLALVAPFALFAIISIVMGLAGPPFAWNTPWLLWILFSVSAVPFAPSVILLAAGFGIAVAALGLVIRFADRLSVLQ